jgi:signal transduction histidine kinase
MPAVMNPRTASRTLQGLAIAAAVVTGLATWIAYGFVARHAPSQAQPVVWMGLVSLLSVLALAVWSVRAVASVESHHNKERLRLFAAAVHDLRQPVQAATLFVDALLHSSLGPQPLKAAQCLDQSMQSMRGILDNLLDSASLDAGAFSVNNQPFSLTALLQALEAEFTPQALSKNLRFCLFCPSTDVAVNGDPQGIRMIVRKVLIHAIAETQQGGVLLGVRQRGSQILIQVWDTRRNVPTDPHPRPDRGLAVARRVAALIQSPLSFESKMGRGGVCTLTLLRDTAPNPPHSPGVPA